MLHLELHPGDLSPGCYISSMLLHFGGGFPISILPHTQHPLPMGPCHSVTILLGRLSLIRALSYLTRLDMHGHQTEPAIQIESDSIWTRTKNVYKEAMLPDHLDDTSLSKLSVCLQFGVVFTLVMWLHHLSRFLAIKVLVTTGSKGSSCVRVGHIKPLRIL